MAGSERRTERIRALIEEVDRVCEESESLTSRLDHSMKREAFYPDRRKNPRFPSAEPDRRSDGSDST